MRMLTRPFWYRRRNTDRRARNEEEQEKRQRTDRQGQQQNKPSTLPAPFSAEEIAAEERRPKHKVAVLIGYSGTGYKGLQISSTEKTIEGDLFQAFVDAGAISKANATDPKKSQLVRCARTDKGVHAAGNVLSLKLIIEDDDIVEKINSHLSPQIRVWGIHRTTNSFNSYQACDSRQYEYLLPTHTFIPPHPSSWLAKKLEESATEDNDREGFESRQAEMKGYWEKVDGEKIQPVIDSAPEKFKQRLLDALYQTDHTQSVLRDDELESGKAADGQPSEPAEELTTEEKREFESLLKTVRNAYRNAKREYRIPSERLARIQPILDMFLGAKNFHNFTIEKTFKDPSAQRYIRSYKMNPTPIVIDGTQWISIKIWGQSFMMHQIRKMIGMLALTIRCGADPTRVVPLTLGPANLSIPKVPGLGLLLERPIFSSYNEKQAAAHGRDDLQFERYETEMDEFKQREIYERMYREENESNAFHTFFASIDNWRIESFLWLASGGVEFAERVGQKRIERGEQTAAQPADLVDGKDEGEDEGEDGDN